MGAQEKRRQEKYGRQKKKGRKMDVLKGGTWEK